MAVKKIDKQTQSNVALLAAQGNTVTRISKKTGLHHTTVKKVLQEPFVIATREEIEERLADKFEKLCEIVLDSVSEDDLLKASLQQKSISAATMLDKSRMIRGQSNINIAVLMASAVLDAEKQIGNRQPAEEAEGGG